MTISVTRDDSNPRTCLAYPPYPEWGSYQRSAQYRYASYHGTTYGTSRVLIIVDSLMDTCEVQLHDQEVCLLIFQSPHDLATTQAQLPGLIGEQLL